MPQSSMCDHNAVISCVLWAFVRLRLCLYLKVCKEFDAMTI